MKILLALLLLLLPAAAPALADDASLFALYAQGHYAEAAEAGEAAHSAFGYALAARATMADAVLRPAPCMECLERGEKLARAAVAANPKLADGQIWLAVALGYQARIQGLARARLRSLPEQAKTALDAAIADDPGNPYAVSALGAWHIEVVKAAGPFLARLLYGAKVSEGMALLDRAAKLGADNVAVRYQIALALAGLDPEAYRSRIAAELDAALHATAATAYEKAMQARAADLRTLLAGNRASFDDKVRKYQGYP